MDHFPDSSKSSPQIGTSSPQPQLSFSDICPFSTSLAVHLLPVPVMARHTGQELYYLTCYNSLLTIVYYSQQYLRMASSTYKDMLNSKTQHTTQ